MKTDQLIPDLSSNRSPVRAGGRSWKKTILAALLGVAGSVAVQATSIPLANPSFESPSVPAWTRPSLPDSWSVEIGFGNYGTAPGGYSGSQCVWNYWGDDFFRLYQDTTNTVTAAGQTITAGVHFRVTDNDGNHGWDGAGDILTEVVVRIGGVNVATNDFLITSNMCYPTGEQWYTNVTCTYVTTSDDVGQTIGLAFGSLPNRHGVVFSDDASLETVTAGGPIAGGTATPNPVDYSSNVLFTVTVTNGTSPTISSVILDASAIGGSGSLSLIYAGDDGSGHGVYTNTVAALGATLDSQISLPAVVTDGNSLQGQANITLVVNSPSPLTWGGGWGYWTDSNWQPFNLPGPTAGANSRAIVTNGQVSVNINGGVGGVGQIVLATDGTLFVGNEHFGGYGNLLFLGGTLDTDTPSYYHAYGASILSGVTAGGTTPSTLATTAGSWYNLAYPTTTFAVSNSATLNVSGTLAGFIDSNDNFFKPSTLIKAGGGTLVLSGANTYAGGTTVAAGTLSVTAVEALRTNTTLTVASGAMVNLNFSGTIPLSSLVLNGVSQSGGTYGATGSGADHINDTYFSGTGLVSVPMPLTLTYANLGSGQLQLSWTGAAILQVQTNSLSSGGWTDLPDASPVTVTVDPAVGQVFYRLKQ